MDAVSCRVAGPDDIDTVTGLVAAAFATDPLWSWVLQVPGGGTEHHARLWRVAVEGAVRYPWTWLAGDAGATSVWIPPGGTELSAEQESRLAEVAAAHLGDRAELYSETLERFEQAHPHEEPHYYLSLLATAPQQRGRGIGMALLRDNLARIDAEGAAAYLESSNPANNDRYAGVGFRKIGEFCAPAGGPVVSTMWRASRSGRGQPAPPTAGAKLVRRSDR